MKKINTYIFTLLIIFVILIITLSLDNAPTLIILLIINSIFIGSIDYKNTGDWKSPNLLITIIATAYSIFFPLYYEMGGELTGSIHISSVIIALKLSIIFISSIYLGGMGSIKTTHRYHACNRNFYCLNYKVVKIFLFIFTFLYCISFIQVITSGISEKSERMTGNTASFATFFGGIYFTLGYIAINNWSKNKSIKYYLLFLSIVIGAGYIILEERDELILPILYLVILKSYYSKISLKSFFGFGVLIIFIFTGLGYYRSIVMENGSISSYSLLKMIQDNEFIFAGRNLSHIIDSNGEKLEGVTFLGDILYPLFINIYPTGTAWFNETHYENKGFSIVAESFVNFGTPGVILSGLIIGVILNYCYSKSHYDNFYKILYALVLIAAMYSCRSDFASITSAVIRKYYIPYLCIFFGTLILKLRHRACVDKYYF